MSDSKLAVERAGGSSGPTVRAVGGRFAKLAARALFVAAGLGLLAFIGHTAVAGAVATSVAPNGASASAMAAPTPSAAKTPPAPGGAAPPGAGAPAAASTASEPAPPSPSTSRASVDDPVVLNVASETDLRRLPGIGAKRAGAIIELRARLGRFRAIEDLLKVKGIGRAMIRRLRPLVRIDAPPNDAGASPGAPR